MTRGLLIRIVAAITLPLVVAATCVLTQSPAVATACTSDAGVSVVVDSGSLGAGIATVCDPGSGEVASTRFEQSGFTLTYAQRQPGFVCRVNGVPASDPCVNTSPVDAYWGLFWTDGKSGTWTYATLGATSIDVPDGGAVALAWQQGAVRRTPAVAAPVQAAPSPSPTTTTKKPTPQPTRTPTATPTSSAPTSAPTTATPSAPASAPSIPPTSSVPSSPPPPPSPGTIESPAGPGSVSVEPSEPSEPSESATGVASTSTPGDATDPAEPRAAEEESSRVPTWLTLTILGSLLLAIGLSTRAARRRTHQ